MSKARSAEIGAARVLATLFGCGLFPVAPGLAGSVAAVFAAVIWWRLAPFSGLTLAAVGALLFGPAVWAADVTARDMGAKDPQIVVADEAVGQYITFAGATHLNWKCWAAGLILFRVFDMTKPFPVRRLEALPGGLGIVADDAAAGVYAALVLFALGWFNFY